MVLAPLKVTSIQSGKALLVLSFHPPPESQLVPATSPLTSAAGL